MTPYEPHSPIGHIAYQDLLRSQLATRWQDIRGTLIKKSLRGSDHWYERFRMGDALVDRYIGPNSDAVAAQVQSAKAQQQDDKQRSAEQAKLVRVLRAEGYRTTDVETGKLLSALARAGVFRLGGVVVGTIAFQLYEHELGVRATHATLMHTADLDIASFEQLSVAISDTDRVSEDINSVLGKLDFASVPSLDRKSVWRWRQTKRDTLVEFLTPSFDADEGLRDLPALGVSAQALHHLNFLIADPIPAMALYRSGILVQIPRPEAFAIHKLIVADRRREGPDALKARKDRAQAEFLIAVLAEERPGDLAEAYEDALSRGPKWRQRIAASLARMPDTARVLEALRTGA